jgi:preprotein translocase subunit Sec63
MATAEYNDNYRRIIGAGGDPYTILNISDDASDEKIKTQYRRLALLFHVRPSRSRSASLAIASSRTA